MMAPGGDRDGLQRESGKVATVQGDNTVVTPGHVLMEQGRTVSTGAQCKCKLTVPPKSNNRPQVDAATTG